MGLVVGNRFGPPSKSNSTRQKAKLPCHQACVLEFITTSTPTGWVDIKAGLGVCSGGPFPIYLSLDSNTTTQLGWTLQHCLSVRILIHTLDFHQIIPEVLLWRAQRYWKKESSDLLWGLRNGNGPMRAPGLR